MYYHWILLLLTKYGHVVDHDSSRYSLTKQQQGSGLVYNYKYSQDNQQNYHLSAVGMPSEKSGVFLARCRLTEERSGSALQVRPQPVGDHQRCKLQNI